MKKTEKKEEEKKIEDKKEKKMVLRFKEDSDEDDLEEEEYFEEPVINPRIVRQPIRRQPALERTIAQEEIIDAPETKQERPEENIRSDYSSLAKSPYSTNPANNPVYSTNMDMDQTGSNFIRPNTGNQNGFSFRQWQQETMGMDARPDSFNQTNQNNYMSTSDLFDNNPLPDKKKSKI